MTMIFELEESAAQNARMKVVGVGGGGGNAVNRMIEEHLDGVEFISVNTDAQALTMSQSDVKIQIGQKLTRGLGAGARPEIGRQAWRKTATRSAGAGGRRHGLRHLRHGRRHRHRRGAGNRRDGAGDGALTVGIVTKPFLFEGKSRMKQAEEGLGEMRKRADTMIVVPNERLLSVVGKGTRSRTRSRKPMKSCSTPPRVSPASLLPPESST